MTTIRRTPNEIIEYEHAILLREVEAQHPTDHRDYRKWPVGTRMKVTVFRYDLKRLFGGTGFRDTHEFCFEGGYTASGRRQDFRVMSPLELLAESAE